MHSTDDINDGYIGSGKRLWRSIKKYGKNNFKCEIIEYLPDRNSLKNREKEIVNEDMINNPLCMNLMTGGEGGFISAEQQKYRSQCASKAFLLLLSTDEEFRKIIYKKRSLNMKKNHENGKIKIPDTTGRKHTEETKTKIGKANSIQQKGNLNSQFGTCWITNGNENKKIKKTESHLYENDWKLGRNMKKNNK